MMDNREKILTSAQVRNKTIISFLFLFLFIGGCIYAWKWLHKQPKEAGALKPLRTVLDANESFFTGMLFSSTHLTKTYSKAEAVPRVRVNGDAGLSPDFDPASWKLQLIKKPGDTLFISLDELKTLPKTEIIFDFKCIEGWSQVTHWGGVRFSDFVKKYGLEEQAKLQFTGMYTPDQGYYVGLDNKSMMHPQTLLCYEMNGAPLPMNQGYPLRLIIPVKYGVKHLKRIGTIFFSNERPPDYWYERGYDYYCGL
jgi:DMSO/TMAO reductase YedYZ molybdopterin-dependent catalytic subunit